MLSDLKLIKTQLKYMKLEGDSQCFMHNSRYAPLTDLTDLHIIYRFSGVLN